MLARFTTTRRNECTLHILVARVSCTGASCAEQGANEDDVGKKREDNKDETTNRSRRARKFVQPVTADLTVTKVTL
ncbi:hypothetical protein WN51_01234 [Melipona quadrifasciata]|uniref:Uncharacterized protein n=1 Tax=Melipona quadrifasciata TaxID=166423 RepID=A0A0M8ZYG4_9HYME|nr:hypothetical protein WN51_01234 [Melipona quadrifasciata]